MARVDPDNQFGLRVATAAKNQQWLTMEEELNILHKAVSEPMRFIGAWVYSNVAVGTLNATPSVMTLNTPLYDQGGYCDGVGFTIPPGMGGIYVIQADYRLDAAPISANNYIGIRQNNTMLTRANVISAAFASLSIHAVGPLTPGDQIRMIQLQNSGGAWISSSIPPSSTEAASPGMRIFLTS